MTDRLGSHRRWIWPALTVLGMACLGLGVLQLSLDSTPDEPLRTTASGAPSPRTAPSTPLPVTEALARPPAVALAAPVVPAADGIPLEPAHWHLADARTAGDPRTPPIVRAAEPPAAERWQLDSPSDYLAREDREHRAVQQAFVDAADRELPALRRLLDLAREQGLSPEGIAKGEEKLRRIAEQREAMRAALATPPLPILPPPPHSTEAPAPVAVPASAR